MIQETLLKLKACEDARQWASQFDDWQALWDNCERGDWMLWLCGKYAGDHESEARKILVSAACDCAELALKYVNGDDRPKIAINTARKWIKGEVSIEEVRKAADAADAAYAAADAAYAAADAADAAADAAYAAADAAYAAADAAADAADAAADAARKKNLKKCADIVRKHYPKPPINE